MRPPNFDIAGVFVGEAVGLIHDIPKAEKVVDRLRQKPSKS